MPEPAIWILGYSVAALGHFPAKWFVDHFRGEITEQPAVPNWATGLVERIIFATLVWARFSGVVIAMLLWLTLKLAANWGAEGRFSDTQQPVQEIARIRLTAVVAGLISLFFAALGGLVLRL